MKTLLLMLLILTSGCEKEEPEAAPAPTPIVTPPPVATPPPPPLPDKIFSVRVFEVINDPEWSNALGWNHFETYNLTTNGVAATAIDMYWLAENDTIGISGKFKPAFPYDTVYAYIRSWDSLADTIPTEWKDTIIVNLNEFNYTYIYN